MGDLGLWNDRCEPPGREEDGQVLRQVVYSRCQIKRFASNLQIDFTLEIQGDALVRPRLRDGVAERTEFVDLIARERHDTEAGLPVEGRGHADEALDVRGHGLVRLAALDDPLEGDARVLPETNRLGGLHRTGQEGAGFGRGGAGPG